MKLILFLAVSALAFGQFGITPNPGDPYKMAANPAVGTPAYSTQTITASPMTITNATHGQGARAFPECFTGAGPWTGSSCSYTVAANGDLVITYTVAPTRIDVFGSTGGFANPMTTAGDIILGGAAGVATRSTLLGAGIVAGASALTTTGAVPYVTSSGVLGQDQTAGGQFFWDATNHRLGIGTNAPGSILDVNGIILTKNNFGVGGYNAAGSNTTTIIKVDSSDNTSFYAFNNGTASILFSTAAIERMRIVNSGNVLIGGTTDGNYRLDVQKSGSTGTARFWDQTLTTGATSVLIQAGAGDASGAKLLRGVLNDLTEKWSITAGGAATFAGDVNSSGNLLGVGDVRAGATYSMLFQNRTLIRSPADGKIQFSNNSATAASIWVMSAGAGSPNTVVVGSPGDIYFNTSGGAGATLYVKESGSATNTGWVAK